MFSGLGMRASGVKSRLVDDVAAVAWQLDTIDGFCVARRGLANCPPSGQL